MLYPFYDLMIFIYNPKELKLSSRKQYKSAKGPQLGGLFIASCEFDQYDQYDQYDHMTFDEVGAPARLSGGPSNIPYGNTINSWFRAREASEKVWEEREGHSDHLRPKIVLIGPVVQALEQFSRMQSELEQTLALGRGKGSGYAN